MRRVIDLTAPGDEHVQHARVAFEPLIRFEEKGFKVTRVITDTHAGTHMDAPAHMVRDGQTIEATSLETCMGKAHVLDLSQYGSGSGRGIAATDLEPFADVVAAGRRLLLYTGWDKEWGKSAYRERHPYLTSGAAKWLVDHGVELVGVDFPSVGPLDEEEELVAVHRILLGAGVVIVECLVNLEQLPPTVDFVAMPLKWVGMDGSPVRAVAVISD